MNFGEKVRNLIDWFRTAPARFTKEIHGFKRHVKYLKEHKNWRFFCFIAATYSLMSIIVGVAYLPWANIPEALPFGLSLLAEVIHPEIWGFSWMILGIWGLLSALTGLRSNKVFIFMFAISIIWALTYLAAFFLQGGRGYLSSAVYIRSALAPLLIIWTIAARRELIKDGRG